MAKKDRSYNKVFNNNQGRGTEKLSQTETSSKQEGLTFAYTDKNGKKYTFRMPNESENAINIDQARPYTEKADDLIEYAKKLRRQKLFGEIDVEELAKSYPFVPFKYQIENVKTMLNRFEGNGVFGDQVGLGKTVQALMTAHAMFASGAIRNALIVVTAKTKAGWIEEIENKFPGVFEICKEGTFIDILKQMKSDNDDPKKSGNRIYIVTEYMLRQNLEAISYAFTTELFKIAFNAPLSEENEKDFKKVEERILGLEVCKGKQDIENILKSCGWKLDEYTSLVENETLESSFLYSPSDLKYAKLENILEARLDRLKGQARRDKIGAKHAANETNELLQEIQNEHKRQESLLEIDKILGLLTSPEKRLIDLLIVDEVHSFYDKEASNQENFSEADLKSAVDILAKIHKKYCILLSATPIRTRLEDIFDLIFIADRKRVGEDRDAALAYFYNTICQLPKEEKDFLLSKMIYDEERRKNFFGMVNNFFTRKRICEVEEQMGKTDNKAYDGYYEKFKEEMINARSLMYMQAGEPMGDAEKNAKESYDNWVKKNCPVPGQNSEGEEWIKNPIKHWNAALDKVFIKEADNGEKDSNERRMAHDRVNWRRRHKCGIAVTLDEQNGLDSMDEQKWLDSIKKVLCCSGEQDVWAEAILLKMRRGITSEHIFMKDSFDIETLENFRNSLRNDTVAVYVSRGETRGKLQESLAAAYQNRTVAIPDKADKLPEITKENYNQIVLLDGGFQAGVNLQQYRTLVFAQMDYRGQRWLEPVDIEQWIGRIHRTGQVKNCRIITILGTDMKNVSVDYLNFLKWYYEILSDPEGLDLYGDNTPDVAFLQPIIVDQLRSMIFENFQEKDNTGFARLLEYCYYLDVELKNNDKKTEVKEMIRKLCKIEELGGRKAEKEKV